MVCAEQWHSKQWYRCTNTPSDSNFFSEQDIPNLISDFYFVVEQDVLTNSVPTPRAQKWVIYQTLYRNMNLWANGTWQLMEYQTTGLLYKLPLHSNFVSEWDVPKSISTYDFWVNGMFLPMEYYTMAHKKCEMNKIMYPTLTLWENWTRQPTENITIGFLRTLFLLQFCDQIGCTKLSIWLRLNEKKSVMQMDPTHNQ